MTHQTEPHTPLLYRIPIQLGLTYRIVVIDISLVCLALHILAPSWTALPPHLLLIFVLLALVVCSFGLLLSLSQQIC